MTVHQRNEESRETCCYPVVSSSPCSKNHWPGMDNDSSSWDRNSRATSSSWPGDMEEAATRKVLQLWAAIERKLFNEDEDVSSLEPVSEECNQWRSQLTHLRIVGKSLTSPVVAPQEPTELLRSTSSKRPRPGEDRFGEEIIMQDTLYHMHDSSNNNYSRHDRLAEEQNQVFEQILDFVCSEFARQVEKKQVDTLGRDLDEVLRITPAPTYSGRKDLMKGRKRRENEDSRKSSANENRGKVDLLSGNRLGDVGAEKHVLPKNTIQQENGDKNNESNDEDAPPQVARNKLGTVFNEKIVVSPVPFVVSTRESFTTLRTTPISFRAQTFEISTPQGLGRYMNSASKISSAQRISGLRIPQSHSAWQTPVCPTVWPKNVRLAPIDPSRLPSSKNRFGIVDRILPNWITRMALSLKYCRDQLPYVPIPLEEIDRLVKLDNFSKDAVKTIETIGVFRLISPRKALLIARPGLPKCKLRLAIDQLDCDVNILSRYSCSLVRVRGTLQIRNKKIVLSTEQIIRPANAESALKCLILRAREAYQWIDMYSAYRWV